MDPCKAEVALAGANVSMSDTLCRLNIISITTYYDYDTAEVLTIRQASLLQSDSGCSFLFP